MSNAATPDSTLNENARIPFYDLGSIIELELAEAYDENSNRKTLVVRDMDVSAEIAKEGLTAESQPEILALWLESRRADQELALTKTGKRIRVISLRVGMVGFLSLALLGASFAWATLKLKGGGESVDIITFWCLTAFIPALFTLWAIVRQLPIPFLNPSDGSSMFREALAKFLHWRWHKKSPSGSERWTKAIAEVEMRLASREGILGAMLSQLVLKLGLGSVIGIWAAVAWFETWSDQRYSWSSQAASVTEKRLATSAAWIALPWSWYDGAGSGYPTYQQIKESRVTPDKQQPSQGMNTRSAWISFVNYSILVYALFPRIILLGIGKCRLRSLLKRNGFKQERFNRICQRLLNPSLGFRTASEALEQVSNGEAEQEKELGSNLRKGAPEKRRNSHLNILLIPAGFPAEDVNRAISRLPEQEGQPIDHQEKFSLLPKQQKELLTRLMAENQGAIDSVLVLQDLSLPPMDDFRSLHQRLREYLGDEVPVRFVLTSPQNTYQPSNLPHWKAAILNFHDPFVSTITLSNTP